MFQLQQRRLSDLRKGLDHHLLLCLISDHLHPILLSQFLQTLLRKILKLHPLLLSPLPPHLLLVLILHLLLNLHSLLLQHLFLLLRREEGHQPVVVAIDERDLDLEVEFFLLVAFEADFLGSVVLAQFSKLYEDTEVGHEEASEPVVLLVGREEGEDVVIASVDRQDLVMLPLHLQVVIYRRRGLGPVVEDLSVVGQHSLLLNGGYECVLIGAPPFEMDERFSLDLLLSQRGATFSVTPSAM